jgi:hypothetical protein
MMNKIILSAVMLVVLSFAVNAQVLRVGMVVQDPDPVRAGDVVEIRFKMENLWDETKYNVKVELVPEFPFSVYSGSNFRELGRVDGTRRGGDATYFDYKLRVDHDAIDGDHEVKLIIYDGDTIWKLEDMFFVDIEKEDIILRPYVVSSDLVTGGSRGSFTIEIANAGGTDVEALELELGDSLDYRLISTSNYIYLGDLEADDTESEDFNIYVDEGVETVSIPVTLRYEVDDKDYVDTYELVLNLLSKEEAKKIGLVKTSNVPYIIGAVAVIIVGIVLIRRRRKR